MTSIPRQADSSQFAVTLPVWCDLRYYGVGYQAGLNGIALSEPGEILRKLNLIVKRVNFGRLRMSLNIAKVCESTVQISSAAMPPLFLYSSSRMKRSKF